jgi:hypothetical protein
LALATREPLQTLGVEILGAAALWLVCQHVTVVKRTLTAASPEAGPAAEDRLGAMPAEDYVVVEHMAPARLTDDELRALEAPVDAAIRALAAGVTWGRSATALAALTWVENFYLNRREVDYDALIAPILDEIVSRVPPAAGQVVVDGATVLAMLPLIRASETYHEIADAFTNAMKGRAHAWRTATGRVAVYPAGDIRAEQRGKWFELRWRNERRAAGANLLPDNAVEKIRLIDLHIEANAEAIQNGSCEVPAGQWYEEYCGVFVDRALEGQFAHVRDAEVWAGLPVADMRWALRPLWMRAARRLLVHLRAVKWLKEVAERRPEALLTAVECVTAADLLADFQATGLQPQAAQDLLASLMRTRGGERFPIPNYPLIPLQDGRVAFAPSAILFSNWPMARERAAARGQDGGEIGQVRDARNVARVVDGLRAHFPGATILTEVLLRDADDQDITDLDVVCISPDRRSVLVLQLKSFVTPLNLMDLDRADRDVDKGVEQCRKAVTHQGVARPAIEAAAGAPLDAAWSLFQCVVTEAITGTSAPVNDFPVITMEWLENAGAPALGHGGIAEFHRRAQTLPDGQAFFESCVPLYALVEDGDGGLTTGIAWAIWAYAS